MRADPEKGSLESESFRAREWRLRPKEKQGSAVQVFKREATVRWLGEVGWRSIDMKWWRERRVLA